MSTGVEPEGGVRAVLFSSFWPCCSQFVLLCFIDPRVKKIRNDAFSCPMIFSRTLQVLFQVTMSLVPLESRSRVFKFSLNRPIQLPLSDAEALKSLSLSLQRLFWTVAHLLMVRVVKLFLRQSTLLRCVASSPGCSVCCSVLLTRG